MVVLQALSQIAAVLPQPAYRRAQQMGHFAFAAAIPMAQVMWIDGYLRHSGRQVRLLAAGEPPWVNYLPDQLLRPGFAVVPISRVRAPMVPHILSRHRLHADLVIVRMDHGWAHLALGQDYLRVPEWLGAFIDLPEDLESFLCANESRHSDVRRLRRDGYSWHTSSLAQDLETLYLDFHVPFIQRRFGAHAHVARPWTWQRQLARGGVLWVLHKGRRVAGLFFTREGKSLRLYATGAVNDAQARAGFAGLYAFACTHAHALGLRSLNLGGCRPTVGDGVFRYKRKWGARFGVKADQVFDLYLWWNKPSLALDELLHHTPLVVRHGTELSHVASLPSHDAGRARSLAATLHTPGISNTILLGRPQDIPPRAALPIGVAVLDPRIADDSRTFVRTIAKE